MKVGDRVTLKSISPEHKDSNAFHIRYMRMTEIPIMVDGKAAIIKFQSVSANGISWYPESEVEKC